MISYETTLTAADNTGCSSCRFEVRHSEDHYGFVHESGFAITISGVTRRGNEFVHYLNAEIDSAATGELSAYPELWAFLERCTPDARMEGNKFTLNVDNIGYLPQCGFFARYLRAIHDFHPWPTGTWILADALKYETLNTLAWLCQVKEDLRWLEGLGLVIEDNAEHTEEKASFLVPVCANLPRSAILTWLCVDGDIFANENQILGFRLSQIVGFELEIRPQRLEKSDLPELTFHAGWPTIRIPDLAIGEPAKREWGCEVVPHKDSAKPEQTV